MIKRSLLVAVIAVILSLFVHGLLLDLSTNEPGRDSAQDGGTEADESSSTFEDLAEVTTEAEEPPVTETDPVEEVEDNTSLALVASDNPRNTLAPDTGDADFTEPDAAEEVVQSEEASQAEAVEADPPAQSDAVAEDVEAARAEPESIVAEPVETDVTEAEEPQETEPVTPEVTVAEPVTEPDSPLEVEPVEAEEPDIVVASLPEEIEIEPEEQTEDLAASAVTTSLRPPPTRPTPDQRTAAVAAPRDAEGYIESPISAYQRTGVDLLSRSLSRSRSGASNFSGARAAGNSNTTNYVGRVLILLNRSPIRITSASGEAQVQFQIDPDGSLAWVRILGSRGSAGIERAATAQVRGAAPFPPPPSGKSQRLVFLYQNR